MQIDRKTREKIKNEALAGELHRKLARKYGVGVASVSRIRNEDNDDNDDIIEVGKTVEIIPPSASLTSIGVVANDAQVPFHDPVAINLFFDFCKREQPDWIDLNGDWLDFYQISQFLKNPMRKNSLQDDINLLVDFLRKLRAANPKARIYYEQGNHEARLRKYLWQNKEIACLDCLRLEKLLKFDEIGIEFVPKWRKQGDLYIMHGTVLSKHAGYSAKLHFEKYGVTMIHGHSHRDGKFTRRTLSGHKAVWENYCLCRLDDVEYDPFPNWVQGFSKVTMVGKRPYVEQIPIINGEYIYGGKRYGSGR